MSGKIAAVVGRTLLKETAANHFGKEDPYFEKVPATRLQRAFGKKTKKRRKAIPPGVSEHDGKILTKVKRRAYRLDYALCNFCGIRFGWSSLIAIIPVAGDAIDALLALMVIRTCTEIEGGLPNSLKAQMLFNLILDFFIGLVPFVGDLADALYKCNSRNAVLLENYLRKQHEKRTKNGQQALPDPSLPEEFDKYDDGSREGSPSRPRRADTRDTEMTDRDRDREHRDREHRDREHRDREHRDREHRDRGERDREHRDRDRDVPRKQRSTRRPEASGGRGWTGGRREPDLEQGTVLREH